MSENRTLRTMSTFTKLTNDNEPRNLNEAFLKSGGFGKLIVLSNHFVIGRFQYIMISLILTAFISGNYII